MQWKRYTSVHAVDPNFMLVAQSIIADCPGNMCDRDKIPEERYTILI